MRTVDLTERAGEDGVLRFSIPVDKPGQEYHVVVLLDPGVASPAKPKQGWPAGFFEETAGQWIGEFPIDPEGDYEERLPL
jgi:hypothetical protein